MKVFIKDFTSEQFAFLKAIGFFSGASNKFEGSEFYAMSKEKGEYLKISPTGQLEDVPKEAIENVFGFSGEKAVEDVADETSVPESEAEAQVIQPPVEEVAESADTFRDESKTIMGSAEISEEEEEEAGDDFLDIMSREEVMQEIENAKMEMRVFFSEAMKGCKTNIAEALIGAFAEKAED